MLVAKLRTSPPAEHSRIQQLLSRIEQALMEITKGNMDWPGPVTDGAPETLQAEEENSMPESDTKEGTDGH